MARDQFLTFVPSSFTLCGRSKFSQVQTTTSVRPFFGRADVAQTRSYSRIRMINDAPMGGSNPNPTFDKPEAGKTGIDDDSDNSPTIDTEEGTPAGENVIPASGVATEGTEAGELPTMATMETDASLSGMGVVRGNLEDGTFEEIDNLPAVVKGDEEGEEMDFTRLMTFDGLKVQTDENGEVIVEELEPPKKYRNFQAMRASREKFKMHETDTGSPEYQIASLTSRIKYMTDHIREHPKDHASTRGLLKMVARRTRLLKYVKRQDENRFHNIIKGLDIRVSQQLRRL